MFGSNGHYGHRSILDRAGGAPDGRPIPGLVQHGWNYDLGATIADVRLPAPAPFYLWSSRNLRACQRAGLGHVVPLGAPFLYMPPAEPVQPQPRSLLVMPMHGWEQEQVAHDFDLYARMLRDVAGDFASLTVCLYYIEHQNPEYRRAFEDIGAEVTTVGKRDDNPRFLFDLRKLVLEHEYVCSNRVQTASFYALHLGRKFFYYGPPVGIESRIDRSGELFDAWQRREFPELAWEAFADTAHAAIGARELGVEFVLERDALAELFLWKPEQAAAFDARRRENGKRIGERRLGQRRELWRRRLGWVPVLGRVLGGEPER
jgi:hypothetical protein